MANSPGLKPSTDLMKLINNVLGQVTQQLSAADSTQPSGSQQDNSQQNNSQQNNSQQEANPQDLKDQIQSAITDAIKEVLKQALEEIKKELTALSQQTFGATGGAENIAGDSPTSPSEPPMSKPQDTSMSPKPSEPEVKNAVGQPADEGKSPSGPAQAPEAPNTEAPSIGAAP